MRFVIVTGMSGAGKSTALKMLEDMGYFCVDNLPIPLLPGFVQMLQNTDTEMKKVALGLDVRSGQDLSGLKENLEAMDRDRIGYEILFLDANDAVLVKRYKETRRQHPLSGSGRVDTGIAKNADQRASDRVGKDFCGWAEFLQSLYYGYVVWVQIWDSAGCGSCL